MVELNRDLRRGEGPSFSSVFEQQWPRIYGYFLKKTSTPELSEDLTQEVFLSAVISWDRFFDKGDRLEVWLNKIAKNKFIDYLRSSGSSIKAIGVDIGDQDLQIASKEIGPEELALRRESMVEVLVTIGQLTPIQREALQLRFMEGLTAREAASVLGTTENTFRGIQFRAVNAVRRGISAQIDYSK